LPELNGKYGAGGFVSIPPGSEHEGGKIRKYATIAITEKQTKKKGTYRVVRYAFLISP